MIDFAPKKIGLAYFFHNLRVLPNIRWGEAIRNKNQMLIKINPMWQVGLK